MSLVPRLRCGLPVSRCARFYSQKSPDTFDESASFRTLKSPWPQWQLGSGWQRQVPGIDVGKDRQTWDFEGSLVPSNDAYAILTSAIIPRPIALVSSLSKEGYPNLAPFSYFSMISHNPPLLSISLTIGRSRPKDTRENILATKEFTVNIVSEHIVEAINATSVECPADIDEWKISGLTMEPSDTVKPARVKESMVNMECSLFSSQDIRSEEEDRITTTLVLGRIKRLHAWKSILEADGRSIDASKLRPVARLKGSSYARTIEGFDVGRYVWKNLAKQYPDLSVIKKQIPSK